MSASSRPEATAIRPSVAQERLWLAAQGDPEGSSYNLCTAHRILGDLDVDALVRSAGVVIERHDSLRMCFVHGDDGLTARVDHDLDVPFEFVSDDGAKPVHDLIDAIARRPLELGTAPLVRFTLVTIGPDDHVLVIVIHHTVADGWSLGVLYEELSDHYGAHIQGMHLVDHVPPPRFVAHAEQERQRFERGELDASVEHWRAKLHGAPRSGLPAAEPRPPEQTFRGARVRSRLDCDAAAAIQDFARAERCSLFTVLLGLWTGLLHRYGAGDDVVVGTPVANRAGGEAREMIGCFVNTVAMRMDLNGQPTLRDLVARAREEVLSNSPHFAAPFERVVEALGATRSTDANVVFQHMLVLLNVPTTALTLPGLTVEPMAVDPGSCQFDLCLDVKPVGDHLELALIYASDLYDETFAEQMLRHFTVLADVLLEDPGTPLSSIRLGHAGEIGGTPGPGSHGGDLFGRRLHELVTVQGERTPEAIAVTCGEDVLTYRTLIERAEALARELTDVGVTSERCVAVMLERSVDLAVAVVAVSRAGGAFVPLDPSWPALRRDQILDDTRSVALITSGSDRQPPRLAVAARGPASDETTPRAHPSDRDLAHVFYTSGSTGLPKGVAVEHRSIVNRVTWAADAYGITAADRVLVNSPFTFDPFVWELFTPLLVGGRAVITPAGEAEHAAGLVARIENDSITVVEFVPSLLTRVLDVIGPDRCRSLRTVLCGSEAMPPTLPARFHDVLDADLYNVYGPTEMSIDSTYWRCERSAASGRVPIGRPIARTTVRVLDASSQPSPAGVPGEICLGGVGVARGYLHRPEETEDRFVPDPFAGPDEKMFRTGDVGLLRPDGVLEFVGRKDDQVSVNGMRVEPGEIEHALRSHPAVAEAGVIARRHERADGSGSSSRLHAFVTVRRDVDMAELRDHLLDRVPRSLVPTSIAVIGEMPLDQNGKVDRRDLAGRAATGRDDMVGSVAPRTEKEKVFHEIWRALLGDLPFGVTDDFFELGGDSILTIEVLALARAAGLGLSARDATRAPTIEELARRAHDEPVPPAPSNRSVAALAPAQAWFFDQRFHRPQHFNDAVLLRLLPSCDVNRFVRALDEVVSLHRELGLRITAEGQGWDGTSPRIGLARADLIGLSDTRQIAVRDQVAAEVHGSLDPETGRLAGGAIFTTEEHHDVLLVLHHLVADAVTWRTLLHEVGLAYHDKLTHASGDGRLLDWIEDLRAATAAGAFDDDIGHWLEQQGPPVPRDRDGDNLVGDAAVVRQILDPRTTDRLLRLPVPGAVATALITALVRAMHDWLGTTAVALALESHGRDLEVGQSPGSGVGWFTSLYPARLAVKRGLNDESALVSVADQLSRIPNRGASYGWLRHHHPHRSVRDRMAGVSEPDVLFNYAGQFDHVNRTNGLFRQLPFAPGPLQAANARRSHLIEINSFVIDGRVHAEWTYGARVHDPNTVEELIAATTSNLEEIAESPARLRR